MRNCPFCDSNDCQIKGYSSPIHTKVIKFRVQCYECGAEGPIDRTEEGALSKWNVKLTEDAMGGVSAPAATLTNTPGMGNATPGTAATNGIGSGDRFDNVLSVSTQNADVTKKEKTKDKNKKKTHTIQTLKQFSNLVKK